MYITTQSRQRDKALGLDNDLNKEWVHEFIKGGCAYCGESSLQMTLDRIDNGLGHIKSNVHPACVRCNFLRRDMPFCAWVFLLDGLRKAREKDAFGKWMGFGKREFCTKTTLIE